MAEGFEGFIERLRGTFSSERFLLGAGARVAFETDGLTALSALPLGVVFPENEAEIIAAVRACHEFQIPYVARGSGTSLSGGAVPVANGLVIALNRLNRLLTIDPLSRTAVVQPGAINLAVTKAAEPFGLYYAPDPSSQQVCTIGGNLAFNSGGAHCLKYGMTTNHVLGVRVVLSDGEVVTLGSDSLESVEPDWVGLFCGSEGLMGIATEITLRLLPKPAAFYTVLAGYDSLEAAGDAVARVIRSGLLPGAMEIMDRLSMRAASAAVGAEYPPDVAAVLIVELDGAKESVAAEQVQLEQLIRESGASAVIVARDAYQRATIWKGRKSVFSAVGRLSPDFIVQDGVVPRGKLGYALREIEAISKRSGVEVANVFHAGDGNLHPLILYDGRQAGALHRAEEVAAEIVRLCIRLGGSITGEHGVGLEKKEFLGEMFDETSVECMRQLRRAVDPLEIANRGKMFPSGQGQPTSLYGLHPLEQAGVISRM